MATENMTTRWVETVKPSPTGRVDYFDEKQTGLVLRVSETGRKVWGVMYRVRGRARKRRLTLQRFPSMSLAEARDTAQAVTLAASKGRDPARQKQEDLTAPTFEWLAGEITNFEVLTVCPLKVSSSINSVAEFTLRIL